MTRRAFKSLALMMLVTVASSVRAESIVINIGDAEIEVVVMPGELSVDQSEIEAYIHMSVGKSVSAEDFRDDWRLVHELVHLAFPQVDNELAWMEEGLATYVEPIARARSGTYSTEAVWGRFIEGMPFGAQQLARQGLNDGQGWSRTYWGGALFCLLADLKIREETNGELGLQDALAGIVSAGGSIEQAWTIEEVLEAADAAVGTTSLSTLYLKMSVEPVSINLEAIWQELGVRSAAGNVAYEESAPKEAIRRAILP